MADPPPPSTPPIGSTWGSTPQPPSELPRLPSAGSGSGRARGPGYPPGLGQSSSTGALQGSPVLGGDVAGGSLSRPGSSGSLRPGSSGGLGPRNPSRDQLQPLQTVPSVSPGATVGEGTPRQAGRLAPLGTPSRPGSGGSGGASPNPRLGSNPGSARPDAVPPLGFGSAGGSSSSTSGAVPPPPKPLDIPDARKSSVVGRLSAEKASKDATQAARGPVKWVAHTHANPKHAKFCFICLHGKLDGQADGVEDRVQERMDEDDLPPPADMKMLAYLLPGHGPKFARTGGDYEYDNLTALWNRDVSNKIYHEIIRGQVAEQNRFILTGGDVKLTVTREDDHDRAFLAEMFKLDEEESTSVEQKIDKLSEWCRSQEKRLVDVMPEIERQPVDPGPEVDPPNDIQKALQEYKPLLDLSQLKGDSAADVRDLVQQADAAIAKSLPTKAGGAKREFEGFKVGSLPKPQTHPDIPECKVVPYPLSVKDVPTYEFLPPGDIVRKPVEGVGDPFPRAFLHLPDFYETVFPSLEGAVSFGNPRPMAPAGLRELWLASTRSIHADNNPEPDPEEVSWGDVPARDRQRLPFVDEPFQPPIDIVLGQEGKQLVIRGMWDPELMSPAGEYVPPIRARGKLLYMEPEFEHPEKPLWSANLAPTKPRTEKIASMCKIVPVRSYSRFKPKKVSTQVPDFLWALGREDVSGQTIWTVVQQRHEIPADLRAQQEEVEREQMRLEQEEADAIRRTMEAEQAALQKELNKDSDDDDDDWDDAPATNTATRPDEVVEAATEGGLPAMHVDDPEAPEPAPLRMGGGPAESEEADPDAAPGDGPAPPRSPGGSASGSATASASASVEGADATRPLPGGGAPAARAATSDGARQRRELTLKAHEGRVAAVTGGGGSSRGQPSSIEDLFSDDRIIDTLAEKIAAKLGGPSAMATTMPALMGGTQSSWVGGGGGQAALGSTARLIRPDPPSFAEPVDSKSRAELPPPLQGGNPSQKGGPLRVGGGGIKMPPVSKPATSSDVNEFTMEKMRGDCYVRLLVKPETNMARKESVPYKGATVPPDSSLITGQGRPLLRLPPKPAAMTEDGEYEEEDPYAEFEKNDSIIFSFVRHNHYESVEALIQQNMEVTGAKDEAGNSLLHIACQNNNRRIAKLLLASRIDVNDQNRRGNTALHYCYQYDFNALIELLTAYSADETIQNDAGFYPSQGIGRDDNVGDAQQQMRATGGL
eukprot:TRINITY_DN811_c0_g1_i1.p1 TRINITY_DN811_c0_g1~~TRINITY_DN811_c0_g1_i1.p1  ORF type:complete len:1218 (+),score=283.26 TRINITY_DN811_c0_g1_i1:59-3712(+)